MESILVRQLVAPAAAAAVLSLACAPLARAQVSSVSPFTAVQFKDVLPTDWAYQALQNLVEQHGCVAGYPSGRFQGLQSISRYEAAALLNACLDRITAMTDEVKGLIHVFRRELAVIQGRVDGLEARMGELEATQFSTTTKLSGLATFVVGANHFSGSDGALADQNNQGFGATTFNSDLQLILETSFSGKDLLMATLQAGNFGGETPFGGGGPSSLATLETSYEADGGANQVAIDKLFYSFPIGEELTLTFGPQVGQEDMLAIWPSAYSNDPILDVLSLNGAPAAYNNNLGPGAGFSWSPSSGLRLSANYVAANGALSNSAEGGIGTDHAASTGTVQLGWEGEGWALAGIVSKVQNGHGLIAYATPFTQDQLSERGVTHAFGLGGYWQPADSGWIPSVSAGWGMNSSDSQQNDQVTTSQSWSLGLEWSDLWGDGHAAGMAVGQPVFATDLRGGDTPADGQFLWEWWLQLQMSDAISITPAVFYLSRPLGQNTPAGESFNQLGALVKTTFRF